MNHYVDAFLKEVLEKVRYKKIHPYLAQELNDHIECLKEDFIEEGLDEERAYEKAVAQMGEAGLIGENLHKMHKPRMEWSVLLLFIGLLGIGIFTLFSYGRNYGDHYFYKKQLLVMFMSVITFSIAYFSDYRRLENHSRLLYMLGLGILIMTQVIGVEVNGTKRWLHIGPIVFEAATLAIPLLLIAYVSYVRRWANKKLEGYMGLALLGIIPWVFCMLNQFAKGHCLLVGFLAIFIFYVCSSQFKGNKKSVLITLGGMGTFIAVGVMVGIITVPYRLQRVKAWINPNLDPYGDGYLARILRKICEDASLIGNQGVAGTIVENSQGGKVLTLGNYSVTDYAFNFIIGSMGKVIAFGIALVVGGLIIRCFKSAYKVKEEYGRLLILGLSSYLAIRCLMGIGINVGLLPMTSCQVPFISYGGSALICDITMMGFILGIYRRKDICPVELVKDNSILENQKPDLLDKFSALFKTEEVGEDLERLTRTYEVLDREMAEIALKILQESDAVENVEVIFKER